MKTILFYHIVLSFTGLLCCHGQVNSDLFSSFLALKEPENVFDNSIDNDIKSVWLPSYNHFENIQFWNKLSNVFNRRVKVLEQFFPRQFPINQIIQHQFPTKKLKRSIEKGIPTLENSTLINSTDLYLNKSTSSNVSVLAIENITKSYLNFSEPNSSTQKYNIILNAPSNNTIQSTENQTQSYLNASKTSGNSSLDNNGLLFNFSLPLNHNNTKYDVVNASTENALENISFGQSEHTFKNFFILAVTIILLIGITFIVFKKLQSRAERSSYQVDDRSRCKEETPV